MRRLLIILLFPLLSLAQLELMVNNFSPEHEFVLMSQNDLHKSDVYLIESTLFKYGMNVQHSIYDSVRDDNGLYITLNYGRGYLKFVKGKVVHNGTIVAIFSFDNQKKISNRKKIIDLIIKELSNTDSL